MSDQWPVHDKELLRRVAQDDEQAFRQLFTIYHQLMGAHILRITGSLELAEEVVQDVFLKVWLHRKSLSGIRSFKAYLFTLSKNHALNCLRKVSKERMLKKEWEQEEKIRHLTTSSAHPAEYYHLIDKAIDQLPRQQQKVYLMSRHQRLKYSEIATQLNLSRETVKKYLQFAASSIRSYVRKNRTFFYFITF